MSRKHFEAIAAAIRAEYEHAPEEDRLSIRRITIALASEFRKINPGFDTEVFLDAAYRLN